MVKVITQAQVLAEKFVAEAEQYSKDLVASARTQYNEVLARSGECGRPPGRGRTGSPAGRLH